MALLTASVQKSAVKIFSSCSPGRSQSHPGPSRHCSTVEQQLARLATYAIAPTTPSTYRVGIEKFSAFCEQLHLRPCPASKHSAALFAAHLSNTLSVKTIRAAIPYLHHSNGFRSPVTGNSRLKLALKALQRKQAAGSGSAKITMKMLRDLSKSLHSKKSLSTHDRLMMQAALSVAFFGFLRVSEFTTNRKAIKRGRFFNQEGRPTYT